MDNLKKIPLLILVYAVVAFLFFIFGLMYGANLVYGALDHIQIEELNVDINETKMTTAVLEYIGVEEGFYNNLTQIDNGMISLLPGVE